LLSRGREEIPSQKQKRPDVGDTWPAWGSPTKVECHCRRG
jgi:hypothetical protein